jgi:hypothetical protein
VRLSFGIGAIFVPFGIVISAQYGLAATYASSLSEIVGGVMAPFAFVSEMGGSSVDSSEIPTPAEVFPEEPEAESEAIVEPGKPRGRDQKSTKSKPATARELPSILVRAETVLRLANSGRVPTGKSVTAQGRRPAGVQVFGASSLGVGVRDGDIITRVSGVAVTAASQVIGLVITARGARQAAISAQIYRGQRSYTLTVEQPYVSGPLPPTKSEPDKDAGATAR